MNVDRLGARQVRLRAVRTQLVELPDPARHQELLLRVVSRLAIRAARGDDRSVRVNGAEAIKAR